MRKLIGGTSVDYIHSLIQTTAGHFQFTGEVYDLGAGDFDVMVGQLNGNTVRACLCVWRLR